MNFIYNFIVQSLEWDRTLFWLYKWTITTKGVKWVKPVRIYVAEDCCIPKTKFVWKDFCIKNMKSYKFQIHLENFYSAVGSDTPNTKIGWGKIINKKKMQNSEVRLKKTRPAKLIVLYIKLFVWTCNVIV